MGNDAITEGCRLAASARPIAGSSLRERLSSAAICKSESVRWKTTRRGREGCIPTDDSSPSLTDSTVTPSSRSRPSIESGTSK